MGTSTTPASAGRATQQDSSNPRDFWRMLEMGVGWAAWERLSTASATHTWIGTWWLRVTVLSWLWDSRAREMREEGKIIEQQPWASGLFQLATGGIMVESCPERWRGPGELWPRGQPPQNLAMVPPGVQKGTFLFDMSYYYQHGQ